MHYKYYKICSIKIVSGCLQYHNTVNGKIQSFNFDGTIRNFEPCFNGTEPECGEELHTGKIQLFRVIKNVDQVTNCKHIFHCTFFLFLAHCALNH